MAALDFPPSSESPFIAPNGVVYFWNDDGFWEADTSEVPTSDNTFLKLDASNDPVTGSLNITGDLDITGKMTSASTGAGDGGTTVVTKDFINGNGGTGSIGYWDRSGTSLSPVNGGDSVLIGGTLPGAPNISLNASGSAEFAAAVQVGGDPDNGTSPGSKLYPVGGLWTCRSLDASPGLSIFKEGTTTANCQILADGSATFAGNVGIGINSPNRQLTVSNSANPIISVQNSTTNAEGVFNAPSGGTVNFGSATDHDLVFSTNNVQKASLDTTGNFLIGGTLPSAPNITLNANGQAKFLGPVYAKRTLGSAGCFVTQLEGSADNTAQIFADGSATFASSSASPSTSHTVAAFNTSSNTETTATYFAQNTAGGRLWKGSDGTETSTIWADGSATFASIVKSGDTDFATLNPSGYVICQNSSATSDDIYFRARKNSSDIQFEVRGDGTTYIGGTNTGVPGASSPNISLNASGSATFAEVIKVRDFQSTGGGTQLAPASLTIRPPDSASGADAVITVFSNGSSSSDRTCIIKKNGSADFSGDITAGNVTFDADTADAINVRDRLVEARETFEQLKAAVNGASDFAGLKSALLTALADFS